jgi:signal transduction histidine kinase
MKNNEDEFNNILKFAEIGKISSSLIHDVANPLTGLGIYLNLIKNNKETRNEQLDSFIKPLLNAEHNMRNFLRLIQQYTKEEYTNEKVDINQSVDQVLKIMKVKALPHRISLMFFRNQDLFLRISPLHLFQVLINLISNSIDSCIENTKIKRKRVTIVIEKTHKRIILTICDTGVGISKETLENIFKEGFSTKNKGTGLGLFRTKQIIEKEWHGDIEVYSEINLGTTFIISLPIGLSEN